MPPDRQLSHEAGFTLIELIMVIVLIGILSIGARSLFFSRDSYAGFLARDQLVSAALLAQQQALGMSAVTDPVTLVVAKVVIDSDDYWTFTVTKSGGLTAYESRQEVGASTLEIDGVELVTGAPQSFIWNGQGAIANNAGHEFLFSGEYAWRACLSASGYAWASAGACP